ncbi:DUF6153 family protein [Streptomyces sp. NPDC046859]|uniref:DUF6153 family protein n=1 Tax=Streptomyces sp. NPDC046859 TaxID=3155734 RepID=UPI0033E0D4F6
MTARSPSRSRPTERLRVLLVMTVLAGVLGMHALPASASPALHADRGLTMVMAHAQGASAAQQCAHLSGGAGHLDHADQTCAATGVGSPYTPPALSGAFTDALAVPRGARAPEAAISTRAPPDLSQLQLLRI